MHILPAEHYTLRAQFLRDVRAFFAGRDCLEVETPLLGPTPSVEPFLDSFEVRRPGLPGPDRKPGTSGSGTRAGFLITSPEYNLKILLAHLDRDVFEIAHCFRAGEAGGHHTEEFLMLEWYRRGMDEFALMDECEALLDFLGTRPYARVRPGGPARRRSVRELLKTYADCPDVSRAALLKAARHIGAGGAEDPATWRYDELFFSVFLNAVEPHLGGQGPEFVYHYPPELAALSQIENDVARRFEIYWQGVELANGYFELTDATEQAARFTRENELRRELSKPPAEANVQFLEALGHMPSASGIALGLERLLMVLLDESEIVRVSPFVR